MAFGRLCSKIWDAIPHYGSSSEGMPPSTESQLESEIQDWFSTIPVDNHLTTMGIAAERPHDSSLFQHLQTLLYLRGKKASCTDNEP